MKTVFVTGAGGYAGSRLVDHLRSRGYDVVAGVRNRARKLAYERQNIKSLVCDVADPINVARAIASARPDGVVHLAGPSRSADVAREPLESYQGGVSSWVYVLDAVRRAVPRARILLISAADVYRREPGDAPCRESDAAQPGSLFGSFKLAGEQLAGIFARGFQIDLSIARPFAYTGPNQPETSSWGATAGRIASAVANNQSEVAISDLGVVRDVLHVDDLVSAYERLLWDGKPNEIYNVCSGQGITGRELWEAALQQAGVNIRITDASQSNGSQASPGAWGDPSKLQAFGWQPAHRAADAVQALWDSYRTVPTREPSRFVGVS